MKKYYKDILKKIEEKGFVAYIVGGFVRNQILNINSEDIDIITNATPKDLKTIFTSIDASYEEYGAVKIKVNNHIIDITTFRRELSYNHGKPSKIEYTSSLEEDLKRRDFRINTLCMDSEENIIDLLDGIDDIKSRIIKTIRNADIELKEDPTRILRALRFMSTLDFNLDQSLIDYIVKNKEEITKINIVKRKEELDKLFATKKVKRFLDFIKLYDLEEYIGIKSNNFVETNTVIGVWSQLEITDNYVFSKYEKEQIKGIKSLLQKGSINKYDIYKKGLFICTVAGEILGINAKKINLIYTNLPIKGIIDIKVSSEEICNILNIKPGKYLGTIIKTIESEIIEETLKNEKSEIIKRLQELR